MCELSDIEAAMRALCKQLAKDADELKMAVSKFVDETGKKKENSAVSSSQSSHSTNSRKKNKKTSRQSLVDFEIPSCYGTIELRETLAHAGKLLTEGIDQLGQAKSKIPSQYVQREMDELATNFTVLKEAFIQMWQRMEMNCDDLVVDSNVPSEEDLIRQKSPA